MSYALQIIGAWVIGLWICGSLNLLDVRICIGKVGECPTTQPKGQSNAK